MSLKLDTLLLLVEHKECSFYFQFNRLILCVFLMVLALNTLELNELEGKHTRAICDRFIHRSRATRFDAARASVCDIRCGRPTRNRPHACTRTSAHSKRAAPLSLCVYVCGCTSSRRITAVSRAVCCTRKMCARTAATARIMRVEVYVCVCVCACILYI